MLRSRWSGGTWARLSATVRPPISIRPEVTRSIPARQRSSVVLPEPDGPSRTRNVPPATSSETSRSAWLPPRYTLLTDSMEMCSATGGSSDPAPAGRREQPVGAEHEQHRGQRDADGQHGLGHADAEVVVAQVVFDGDGRGRRAGRVEQLGDRQLEEHRA